MANNAGTSRCASGIAIHKSMVNNVGSLDAHLTSCVAPQYLGRLDAFPTCHSDVDG